MGKEDLLTSGANTTGGPATWAGEGGRVPGRADGRAPGRAARTRRVPHGVGFWFAAVAFAVVMALGTAPVPLWPLYQQRDGFGTTTVTVAFSVLVVGASVGFLSLGHLSDRLGRRRIVVPAVATAIAAALVLTFWTSLPGLLTGRFLNGVAVGLMASTATAYLHDLHRQEHPDRAHAALPGIVATTANLGGLALGPLAAGVIARWAPHPLTVTQGGFAAALVLCLLMAVSTPETVDHRAGGVRPRRFALRPGTRALFAVAAALGFVAFAVLGLVSSLGALILRSSLGISSPLVAGVAPFVMFSAAAVAQLVLGRYGLGATTVAGAVVFPVGLGLAALSLYEPELWLFLVAVALAGAGAGALFRSGIAHAGQCAVDNSRAGVLGGYFVAAYVGMGLPSVVFSVVVAHVATGPAMIGLSAVLSAGAVAAVALLPRVRAGAAGR